MPRSIRYRKAQHIRKITSLEHHLIEIIKYGSKVFTDPDMIKNPKKRKRPPVIYAAALDNIYAAIEGHRLLDRFGFNLSNNCDHRKGKAQLISDYHEIDYDVIQHDWINFGTRKLLTGFVVDPKLRHLLEHNVNIETK